MTSTETTDITSPEVQSGPQPEQPAMRTGMIAAGTTIVLQGLTVFGLATFTTEQRTWIIMAIGFIAPLVTGYVIKGKVFSPASVQKLTAGLIADRQAADVRAVAAQTAVDALQKVLPSQRPRGDQNNRQRPAERLTQPPLAPGYPEPVTNVPAAERRRRPQREDGPPRRAGRQGRPEYAPEPSFAPPRERTAAPDGYYDYPEDELYGGHAYRGDSRG